MQLVLEYDDFCDQSPEDCLNFIEKQLVDDDKIKITLFTVPAMRGRAIGDPVWVGRVKTLIQQDKIRLAVHGLFHTPEEFKNLNASEIHRRLNLAEEIFESLDLPYIKVFRPPHWTPSDDLHEVLAERGYTHWYNHQMHKSYEYLEPGYKCAPVHYNYNLADGLEKFPDLASKVVAHGHTHDVCGNGIVQTWDRVATIRDTYNPEFVFADKH